MLDLKQQRVMVTGRNGFLGRHVSRTLRELGIEEWTPSAREPAVRRYDLSSESECNAFFDERPNFGVVIHLAANCGGIGKNQAMPAKMFRDNMRMGMNIIEQCAERGLKLVLVGTVCSYPANTPVPFKESDLWNGYPEETNAPYGIAKRALFEMARAYHKQYGLKVACLLPANLYGPGDNFDLETSHVIPAMIRKHVEARESRSVVSLWGDGTPTREFLYVEDAAEAIVRAAEVVDSPEPINIGTGHEISMGQLASMVASRLYVAFANWDKSKPNGQLRRCLDTTRAKQLLNWEAKTDLETGLRKTIDWYLANRKEAVTA